MQLFHHAVVLSALFTVTFAFNHTAFNLFKNTGWHDCPSLPTDTSNNLYTYNSTSQASSDVSDRVLDWVQARTQSDFCNAVGNLTVVPTTPTNAGFLPNWPTIAFEILKLLQTTYSAAHSVRKGDDAEIEYIDIRFIPLFIIDSISFIWWWVNLIQGATNLPTADWISVTAFVIPAGYAVTASSIGKEGWAIALRWLATIQMGFCLGVVITRWKHPITSAQSYKLLLSSSQSLPTPSGNAPNYCSFDSISHVQPPYQLSGTRSILTDPRMVGYQILLTLQFGAVVACVCKYIGTTTKYVDEEGQVKRYPRAIWALWMYYGIGVGQVLPMLYVGIMAAINQTPIVLDKGCGLAVVVMNPKFGYFDVPVDLAQRIVQAYFGV